MIEILLKLQSKQDLSPEEMRQAMEAVMTGHMTDGDIELFLVGLRDKGETVDEIVAAARVMRKHAVKIKKITGDLLDTCGTGGDARNTLNVSTLAAIVACGAGVNVAKHGNRSVSSLCGSADLLEMLGFAMDLDPKTIEQRLEETGFGFFFAPAFHPAVKYAMPVRRKIKSKTIFNILGPLSNPAGAPFQLIGVYDEKLVTVVAQALNDLGVKRALVVHGDDGLDEISLCAETKVAELNHGQVNVYRIKPEDFDLKRVGLESIRVHSKEDALNTAIGVLKGKPGPMTDVVCLNAGAALYVAGKAASLLEGVRLAQKVLSEGQVALKCTQLGLQLQHSKHLDELVSEMSSLPGFQDDSRPQSRGPYLAEIIHHKKHEMGLVEEKSRSLLISEVGQLAPKTPLFYETIRKNSGIQVIAEIKRMSPSKGLLRENFIPTAIASSYVDNGAAALSVLTDEKYFGGSAEIFLQVRKTTKLPLLRKEFIIDPYQIYESRALEADAILLIAGILSYGQLESFSQLAQSLGLDVLFEVHTEEEINKILPLNPKWIGINNRNLQTFNVDLDTTVRLIRNIPKDVCVVSESGIQSHADLVRLERLGVKAALVGESLMREKDPGAALRRLIHG